MPPVFLEGAAKPLLVLHALASFALLGACTHQAMVAVQLLRGKLHLARLARIYARTIGALFVAAFFLGLRCTLISAPTSAPSSSIDASRGPPTSST